LGGGDEAPQNLVTPDALKQQLASLLEKPTASSWKPLELPGDWFERRLLEG